MDEAYQKLIYNFAHDLKSPLTGIMGNIELLQYNLNDEKLKRLADNASVSSVKLFEQIEMFLDLFKFPEGLKVPLIESANTEQLIGLVRNRSESVLNRKNLTLECSSECTEVMTDKEILSSVICCLIDCSAVFSRHDDVIGLTFRRFREDGFSVEVTDRGKPYPEDEAEIQLLFDPLQMDRVRELKLRNGKGFSFPYVKSAVDALKGTIQFSRLPQTAVSIHFEC